MRRWLLIAYVLPTRTQPFGHRVVVGRGALVDELCRVAVGFHVQLGGVGWADFRHASSLGLEAPPS